VQIDELRALQAEQQRACDAGCTGCAACDVEQARLVEGSDAQRVRGRREQGAEPDHRPRRSPAPHSMTESRRARDLPPFATAPTTTMRSAAPNDQSGNSTKASMGLPRRAARRKLSGPARSA